MSAVAKIPKTSAAPSIDRSTDTDLASARNALVRDYPAMPAILEVPLPAGQRARLEARRLSLQNSLAPAARSDHGKMAAAISGMLGAFGGAGAGGSPEAIVAKYVQVLSDLPLWAVVGACQAVERGEVDGASLDFRPAAPRLRQVARGLMAPWDEELAKLREVLEAPACEPQDADMRARVGQLLTSLAADLRAGKYSKPAPDTCGNG